MPIDEFGLPSWVPTLDEYTPPTYVNETSTGMTRGNTALFALDNLALPELKKKHVNIAVVGVGFDAGPIHCPYVPYRLTAHLEANGLDYNLVVVDLEQEIIEDFKRRRSICILNSDLDEERKASTLAAWNKYLRDTKQTDRIVHQLESDIILPPYVLNNADLLARILKSGIRIAEIPRVFQKKLINGEISIIQSDIAIADLQPYGLMDFIDCSAVLYLLKADNQKRAFSKMALALAKGGRLLVNDNKFLNNRFLFENGGWLDSDKLRDLGLEREDPIINDNKGTTITLKKVI